MAHVITDNCGSAALALTSCPIGCISEGDSKYVIDADQCVDCGTCAAECPNDAISRVKHINTKGVLHAAPCPFYWAHPEGVLFDASA